MDEVGKKIDIGGLVDLFEAKEGDVEHIIGKTGQGKTYEATRRALKFLREGNAVYTTWRLNLPDYFDERNSAWRIIKNTLLFRKNFFKFDYKKNWHYVDLDDYLDPEGIFHTEKFSKFLASRTDCIFMLDEGQDTFDAHQRAGKTARQSITRTRHMHKKLIIISQRAQAVDVNARANVTWFYKCESVKWPFFPKYFRVRMTDEIDDANNYPLWVRHDSQGDVTWEAPIYHSGFARKEIYQAYDSWFMRKNMERSQSLHVHAYALTFGDKMKMLWRVMRGKKLSTGYPQVDEPLQNSEVVIKKSEISYKRAKDGRFLSTKYWWKSPYLLLPERSVRRLKVRHLTTENMVQYQHATTS